MGGFQVTTILSLKLTWGNIKIIQQNFIFLTTQAMTTQAITMRLVATKRHQRKNSGLCRMHSRPVRAEANDVSSLPNSVDDMDDSRNKNISHLRTTHSRDAIQNRGNASQVNRTMLPSL